MFAVVFRKSTGVESEFNRYASREEANAVCSAFQAQGAGNVFVRELALGDQVVHV